MKFNINDCVKVKLTDKGINILKKNHEEVERMAPSVGPFKSPEVDTDGYTEFQLWHLMATFGEYIGMAQALPFSTDIEIITR